MVRIGIIIHYILYGVMLIQYIDKSVDASMSVHAVQIEWRSTYGHCSICVFAPKQHIYIYIYMYMYIHIYIYIYMCVCVCMYTTCTHIHMYIYIYVYTHVHECILHIGVYATNP